MAQDQVPKDQDNGTENDMPASVIFTEMMRRAASNREAPPPPDDTDSALPDEPPDADDNAKSPDELRHDAAMEAQRLRRVQRRRERRRQTTVGVFGGLFRSLLVIVISAGLMATILSWWTDPASLDADLRANMRSIDVTLESGSVIVPTPRPTPNWMRRIGIISGHSGVFMDGNTPRDDPGAVCYGPDGEVLLTEREINFAVADRVVNGLRELGYTVDLLEEFDPRLDAYQAAALVSIHANDCSEYYNADGTLASAFLVSQAQNRPEGGEDTRLRECIADEYGALTELERRYSLTRDMTDYHIFRSIDARTPGIIIELGFMRGDQELLVNQPDLLALGIINGIRCFLEGSTDTPQATPADTAAIETNP